MIEVRLCGWNIQWGRGRVDLARVAATLRTVDADVVCLQDVAVNHPGLPDCPIGDQLAQSAAVFSGYEAIYAAGNDIAGGCGGRRQFDESIWKS